MEILSQILVFIRLNFFYDLRSSVTSIFALFMFYFLHKLLHDDGKKTKITLKYLTGCSMSFAVLAILL